jgi:dephospho-CoA kinase
MISKIALNGKMTSGKTTIAEYLRDHHGYTILSIGSMIKKVATLLIDNMPDLYAYLKEMVDDREMVDRLFFEITSAFDQEFDRAEWTKDETGAYHKTQPYRKLTQMVATKVRDQLGKTVWTQFCIKEGEKLEKLGTKIVVDDLRLKEEKTLFEAGGYSIIRLHITKEAQAKRLLNIYGKIDEEQLAHETEISLDNANFDLIIDTSGDDPSIAMREASSFVNEITV